jgi:hypothetical protein
MARQMKRRTKKATKRGRRQSRKHRVSRRMRYSRGGGIFGNDGSSTEDSIRERNTNPDNSAILKEEREFQKNIELANKAAKIREKQIREEQIREKQRIQFETYLTKQASEKEIRDVILDRLNINIGDTIEEIREYIDDKLEFSEETKNFIMEKVSTYKQEK